MTKFHEEIFLYTLSNYLGKRIQIPMEDENGKYRRDLLW